MIMTTMLLGGAKSNTAIDQPTYINIDLKGKGKAFKKTKIDETMDLYSLYKQEKDACMRYRLLFVINPICSNVLFNVKTEAVAFEGSDYCVPLNDKVPFINVLDAYVDKKYADKTLKLRGTISSNAVNNKLKSLNFELCDAIRDTEISHKELGDITYHCGSDICNNHIMRSKEFVFCNYTKTDESKKVFNTIEDYVRTEKGAEELDFISTNSEDASTNARLYTVDNIMTFQESFDLNIKEKDGWFGFSNDSNININNVEYKENKATKKISVNRVINNIGSCSFVDLYPDRTLFSAVPKYNKYRNRQEHNWDYCITYPFENEYALLYEINGHFKFTCDKPDPVYCANKHDEDLEAQIKTTGYLGMSMAIERVIYSNSGEKAILFKTDVSHNLHVGHYITIYLEKPNKTAGYDVYVHGERIQVVGVGDEDGFNKEKYFSVRESDMPGGIILHNNGGIAYYDTNDMPGADVKFSYRHNINNTTCQYYIRKFKKIQNITYDVTRLAFGNNIYGDEMAQLMINDDVDLAGLKDNLGRELSEIYLTVIKTNRGHKKWYSKSTDINEEVENKRGDDIEFSHCFGKVTSGFRLNGDNEDYNVLKLHNIDLRPGPGVLPGTLSYDDSHEKGNKETDWGSSGYREGTIKLFGVLTPPKVVEDDITADMGEFYGDIVEFNPNTFEETILAPIYYRFNTEQRECYYNDEYFDIWKDEVVSDNFEVVTGETVDSDYDIVDSSGKKKTEVSPFKVKKLLVNVTEELSMGVCGSENKEVVKKEYLHAGNLNPEGYYYNPHHKIIVRELMDEVSEAETSRINIDINNTDENFVVKDRNKNYDIVRIVSPRDYGFQKGGNVMFYDVNAQKTEFGVIDTVENITTVLVKVLPGSGLEDISKKVTISEELLPEENTVFSPDKDNVYGIREKIVVLFSKSSIPSYAIFRPSTSSYIWRGVMNVSDATTDSPLYDIPFSNGAIYIEKNINLFLLRQDPHSENYLYNYIERENASNKESCGDGKSCFSVSLSSFLRKEGMPKLDIRYLLEGDDNISFDLC